jgi:hypothetical protein
MSTGAVIARLSNADIFRGRIVHMDGYPTWMGAKLWEIYHRDGLTQMKDTIIWKHTYWSQIDPGAPQSKTQSLVEGYGKAYYDRASRSDFVTAANIVNSACQWIYILGLNAMMIGKIDHDTVTFDQ